ncbi:MAG: hypothetical protein AAFP86_16960, partial [Planctomycetota bacterium]
DLAGIELRLEQSPGPLAVHCVGGDDHRPVAGVTVELSAEWQVDFDAGWLSDNHALAPRRQSKSTDSEGRVLFDCLPPASKIQVRALHSSHVATEPEWIDDPATTRSVMLTLDRGTRVSGELRDAAGSPHAGTLVEFIPLHTDPSGELVARRQLAASTVTDSSGRFDVSGVRAGANRALAFVDRQRHEWDVWVTPPRGEVSLVTGGTIRQGRVSCPTGLSTLATMTPRVLAHRGEARVSSAPVEVDGTFRLCFPPHGAFEVSLVVGDGAGVRLGEATWVEPAVAAELEISLERGPDWLGSIRGSIGPAPADERRAVLIQLQPVEGTWLAPLPVLDLETGSFQFKHVPPGEYRLSVAVDGRRREHVRVHVSSSATSDVGRLDV